MEPAKIMKYHILTGILLLGACSNTQDAAVEEGRSEAFGAEEWTQYRHSPDKNAVIDSGHEPLEYAALETEDEVRATPVVADGRLFIGNHNSGDIMAFDLTSGERIWEGKAPNWIHSETIYHEGTIYVGYGNRHFQENGIRGTGENGVMALDAENGEVLWQFETEGEVMPTPAIYEDHLYITTGDRHLYKIGLEEGSLVHQHELGSTISMSSPNIYEDTLYVGGSGPLPYAFYAYDLENDEMKWQTEFPEVVMGLDDVPPAISNGIIVTSALVLNEEEQTEHEIYAMDAKTGELLWKDNWGSGQAVINNKSGAPMIYEDTVFIASPKTKTYYAYDDIVYFSNTEGRVIGLNVESGEPVNEMTLDGTLAPSGPIIVNDTLFVGSQDGNVYIVPLSDFEDVAE